MFLVQFILQKMNLLLVGFFIISFISSLYARLSSPMMPQQSYLFENGKFTFTSTIASTTIVARPFKSVKNLTSSFNITYGIIAEDLTLGMNSSMNYAICFNIYMLSSSSTSVSWNINLLGIPTYSVWNNLALHYLVINNISDFYSAAVQSRITTTVSSLGTSTILINPPPPLSIPYKFVYFVNAIKITCTSSMNFGFKISYTITTSPQRVNISISNLFASVNPIQIGLNYILLDQNYMWSQFKIKVYTQQLLFNPLIASSPTIFIPWLNGYTDFIFGIASQSFTFNPLNNTHFSFTSSYVGSSVFSFQFDTGLQSCAYQLLGFVKYGCYGDYPTVSNFTSAYYTDNQFTCLGSCETGQYMYTVKIASVYQYVCGTCDITCKTCSASTSTDCASCNTLNFRQLKASNQCIPITGYYENFLAIPDACDASCLSCSGSSTSCTSCPSYVSQLVGTSCTACSALLNGCIHCSSTSICTQCSPGYLMQSTYTCIALPPSPTPPTPPLICSIQCKTCLNAPNYCTSCKLLGYYPIGGICQIQCGDGYLVGNQQCDDGNLIDNDGCSSLCSIQPVFQCSMVLVATPATFKSQCHYIGRIEFTFQSVQKVKGKNEIQVYLSTLNKYLTLWRNITLLSIISTSTQTQTSCYVKIQSVQFCQKSYGSIINSTQTSNSRLLQINYQRFSKVKVLLSYNKSIQNSEINLIVSPSLSLLTPLKTSLNTTIHFTVIPFNNQLAIYFNDNIYDIQHHLEIAAFILVVLSWLIILVALLKGGKHISADNISNLQFTYFSLLSIGSLNPLFSALKYFKFSNGISIPINSQVYVSSIYVFNGLMLNFSFLDNFNICIAFLILPVFIGLFIVLLQKTFNLNQTKSEILNKIRQKSLRSYSKLTLIVFICPIICYFIIQIYSSIVTSKIQYTGFIFGFIMLTICLVKSLMYQCSPADYDQFDDILKQNHKKTQNIFQFVRCLMFVLTICLFQVNFVNLINIIILAFMLIVHLKLKIHKSIKDYLRVAFNFVVNIFIQSIFFYENINQSVDSQLWLFLPITIIILLFLSVTINFVFFIIHIKRNKPYYDEEIYIDDKIKNKNQKSQIKQNIKKVNQKPELQKHNINYLNDNIDMTKIDLLRKFKSSKCMISDNISIIQENIVNFAFNYLHPNQKLNSLNLDIRSINQDSPDSTKNLLSSRQIFNQIKSDIKNEKISTKIIKSNDGKLNRIVQILNQSQKTGKSIQGQQADKVYQYTKPLYCLTDEFQKI